MCSVTVVVIAHGKNGVATLTETKSLTSKPHSSWAVYALYDTVRE